VWDLESIADLIEEGLRAAAGRLDREQAVLGVDALDELGHHPVLRRALGAGDYGVWAEQRLPGGSGRRRRSEGERCDIVLTDRAGARLIDPLLEGTLFGHLGSAPEDALWLEVKVVGQFALFEGFARANPAYSSVLLQDVARDVRKLSSDERIAWGAVVIVLYAKDRETAEHDLGALRTRAVERGLPVSAPVVRGFGITDRMGNGWCCVGVVRVHRL